MKVVEKLLLEELRGVRFGDDRLSQRLEKMMEGLATHPASPIAHCFASEAEAKAAYRFFDNEKVTAKAIKDQHREKTFARMSDHDEVLVLQDTTFLDYSKHLHKEGLGTIGKRRKTNAGTRGLIAHHALAMTHEGVPLGLLDQSVWARGESSEQTSESRKWISSLYQSLDPKIRTKIITVADREADIDEFFNEILALEGHLVVRAKKTRASVDERGRRIIDVVRDTEIKSSYEISLTDRLGVTGKLEGRAKRMTTQRREANLEVRALPVNLKGVDRPLNALLVTEKNPPAKGNEIEWFILTDLSIDNAEQCLRVVSIYTRRWLIELFHKTLKTGCGIEGCRLNQAAKVETYVAVMSVIGWWLFYMQQLSRTPGLEIDLREIFDETELRVLNAHGLETNASLRKAVEVLARLGGFKKFKKTDIPGIYSIWLGWLALQNAIKVLKVLGPLQHMGSR